ncbi:tryptophan-specific transport protein isoform X2 [Brassica napus]|uniref:tryptophan-specific transport protein isoform X2 n=1 Tax=Brassica napus TaxID=3708 RepID=UPI002078FBFE|nr:tryptophan-specific transport protein isoform X2 [Brassica napus]
MSVSLSNTCLPLRTDSVPQKPLVLNGVVRFHLQRSSHVSSYRFGFNSNPFFRTHTPRFSKCSPQRVSDKRRETQVTTEQEEEEEVVEFQRLFSNLNRSTLKRESGSLSSAIFLVAGTTVGAGILAIPAVTQESGFLASAVACILCWAFMVVTGLLVAEVNVNTMSELGSGGVSLVCSLSDRHFLVMSCFDFLVLFLAGLDGEEDSWIFWSSSCILVLHSHTLHPPRGLHCSVFRHPYKLPRHSNMGECNSFLTCSWRHMLLWKPEIHRCNQWSSGVWTNCIFCSTRVASGDLHWEALLKANFEAVPMSIPIIALSFVYQNVVPVLCTDLEGDLPKVRTAIVLGTAIPLGLFLVWNAVILGSFPDTGVSAERMIDPLQQLRSTSVTVGPFVEAFSLIAIATSYIGFVLGLTDFFSDLLKLQTRQNKPFLYLLTLVPPLVLSLLDPEIFFKALDFAGTYGVLVLFGILPAAMSWSDRYVVSSSTATQLVPGGKVTLSLVMGAAGYVIVSEIIENFSKYLSVS